MKRHSEKIIFLLVQMIGKEAQLKGVTQRYESAMTLKVGLRIQLGFPLAKDYGRVAVSTILREELGTPARRLTDP